MLLKLSKKVKKRIEEKRLFRYVVLFTAALNYVGLTVLPFLIIFMGAAGEGYYNSYVTLLQGVFFTVLLVYFSNQSLDSNVRYFGGHVPGFLIAVFFTTLVIIFLIKLFALLTIPQLIVSSTAEFYFWMILDSVLWLWQLIIMYILCQQELVSQ